MLSANLAAAAQPRHLEISCSGRRTGGCAILWGFKKSTVCQPQLNYHCRTIWCECWEATRRNCRARLWKHSWRKRIAPASSLTPKWVRRWVWIVGKPTDFSRPHRRSAPGRVRNFRPTRSEEHTSELQSLRHLVCRLLLEKKK